MNKEGNGYSAQTVTRGYGYSAEQLAKLKLPGYPVTRKGWYDRARRENWEMREESGKGPGGVLQIFIPPPEIQALIDKVKRGDIPAKQDTGSPSVDVPYPPPTPPTPQTYYKAASEHHAPPAIPNGMTALFDQQVVIWADSIVRLTLIVRSNHRFTKAPDEFIKRVSLLAFRLIFMFCDGDMQRVNLWLNDAKKTDGLVHMAYEGDCIKRGITPGSDLDFDSPPSFMF